MYLGHSQEVCVKDANEAEGVAGLSCVVEEGIVAVVSAVGQV